MLKLRKILNFEKAAMRENFEKATTSLNSQMPE